MDKCLRCDGLMVDLEHKEPNTRFYLTKVEFSDEGTTALPMSGIPLTGKVCMSCYRLDLYKDIGSVMTHLKENAEQPHT